MKPSQAALSAAVRAAMQDQSVFLSLGNCGALRTALIALRPAMADMSHRSGSWSISHWRARRSDANPEWRTFVPFELCAAENTQHGKQNADRCGASGRNPGRRCKG